MWIPSSETMCDFWSTCAAQRGQVVEVVVTPQQRITCVVVRPPGKTNTPFDVFGTGKRVEVVLAVRVIELGRHAPAFVNFLVDPVRQNPLCAVFGTGVAAPFDPAGPGGVG